MSETSGVPHRFGVRSQLSAVCVSITAIAKLADTARRIRTAKGVSMRRVTRTLSSVAVMGLVLGVACTGKDHSDTSASGSHSGSVCDPAPIEVGTVRGCMSGTTTETAPGVPADFVGRFEESMPLTLEEKEAIDDANQNAARRTPDGIDPADLGFGPNEERAGSGG